jgi:HEAT repeat protein
MRNAGILLLPVVLLATGVAMGADVDALTDGLSAEDATTRIESARELAKLGPDAAQAGEQLVMALDDEYWDVRKAAAKAIGGLGSAGEPLVDDVLKKVESDVPGTRLAAAEALGRLGDPAGGAVPELIETARQTESNMTRAWLIWSVGRIGTTDPNAVDWLLKKARQRDGLISSCAVYAIRDMGVKAIPALFKQLENTRDWREVRAVARAVGGMGEDAVEPTIEAMQSDRRYLPGHTPRIAAAIGKPAIPALLKLLGSEDRHVRDRAREALAKIGRPALDRLIEVLQKDKKRRDDVLSIFSQMEHEAAPAADEIAKIVKTTESDHIKRRAIVAVGEIGGAAATKGVLAEIIAVLKSDDSDRLKRDAARALERMGRDSKPILAQMIALIPELKGRTKEDLIRAIGNHKEDAAEAVDELTAALTDAEYDRAREKAAWALGRIGAAAKPALDELKKASRNDDSKRVKGRAIEAITRIQNALRKKEKN